MTDDLNVVGSPPFALPGFPICFAFFFYISWKDDNDLFHLPVKNAEPEALLPHLHE